MKTQSLDIPAALNPSAGDSPLNRDSGRDRSRRRRVVAVLMAILALTAISGAAWWFRVRREESKHAGLVIEDADLQFGEVWEQQRYRHSVTIRNPTEQSIEVLDLSPSCRCIDVEPKSFVLSPGDSIRVWLAMDLLRLPSARRHRRQTDFEETLTPLVKNARAQPWSLRGTIRSPFSVEPDSALFYGRDVIPSPKTPVERHFRVTCYERVRTLHAEFDPAYGMASVVRKGNSPDEFDVTLLLAPNGPAREFQLELALTATLESGKTLPAIPVPVQGRVRQVVNAFPTELAFPPTAVAQSRSARLVLQSNGGRVFQVEKAWYEEAGPEVRFSKNEKSARQTVDVRFSSAKPGPYSNKLFLSVRLGENSLEKITVPVLGHWLKPVQ